MAIDKGPRGYQNILGCWKIADKEIFEWWDVWLAKNNYILVVTWIKIWIQEFLKKFLPLQKKNVQILPITEVDHKFLTNFLRGGYLISNKPFEFGADPDHKRKR